MHERDLTILLSCGIRKRWKLTYYSGIIQGARLLASLCFGTSATHLDLTVGDIARAGPFHEGSISGSG